MPPADIVFARGPRGKPCLAAAHASGIRFNLAHAQGMAVYIVASHRAVGVDLEHLRPVPYVEEIAGCYFAPEERQAVDEAAPDARSAMFLHIWCLKEAYLKGRGTGLSVPLNRFAVTAAPAAARRLLYDQSDPFASETWWLHLLPLEPGYVGAVAVEGGVDEMIVRHWPSDHSRSGSPPGEMCAAT